VSASRQVERPTDWDRQWRAEAMDLETPAREAGTPRWRAQERLVLERFGSFDGLSVIEIGAGRGTNALLYAQRGARATLLDNSPVALEQARTLFDAHGVPVELVEGDVFDLPDPLRGAFGVSMSFGLCEHFLGARRQQVVAAHLQVLRPGGLAVISVPNRWAPLYRLWMGLAKARGTWELGTEVPFSAAELRRLAGAAGGQPLEPHFGSTLGNLVEHGLNNVLTRLGRRPLPVPQRAVPGLDRLAYELMLPVSRPG
jgi:SAM-dependent methyltransferase